LVGIVNQVTRLRGVSGESPAVTITDDEGKKLTANLAALEAVIPELGRQGKAVEIKLNYVEGKEKQLLQYLKSSREGVGMAELEKGIAQQIINHLHELLAALKNPADSVKDRLNHSVLEATNALGVWQERLAKADERIHLRFNEQDHPEIFNTWDTFGSTAQKTTFAQKAMIKALLVDWGTKDEAGLREFANTADWQKTAEMMGGPEEIMKAFGDSVSKETLAALLEHPGAVKGSFNALSALLMLRIFGAEDDDVLVDLRDLMAALNAFLEANIMYAKAESEVLSNLDNSLAQVESSLQSLPELPEVAKEPGILEKFRTGISEVGKGIGEGVGQIFRGPTPAPQQELARALASIKAAKQDSNLKEVKSK
jgi:hypothetical protein